MFGVALRLCENISVRGGLYSPTTCIHYVIYKKTGTKVTCPDIQLHAAGDSQKAGSCMTYIFCFVCMSVEV